MADTARVYLCIRPTSPERLSGRLAALDEELTEAIAGGIGEYDEEHGCVEAWLFDDAEEAEARRIIARHGFEVVTEEQILGTKAGL